MADFGASRDLAPGAGANASMTMTMAGTPVFMAPEVLRQDRYGKEADVWSFGGLLVHIATRCPPYSKLLENTPPYALMQSIAQGEIRPTSDIEDLCPDWPADIQTLAEACCRAERSERPTFEQIASDLQGTFQTVSLHNFGDRDHHRSEGSVSGTSSRPSAPLERWARDSNGGALSLRDSKVSMTAMSGHASPNARRYGSDAEREKLSVTSFENPSSRRSMARRPAAAGARQGGQGGGGRNSLVRFTIGHASSPRPGTRLEHARQRASQRERSRASPVEMQQPDSESYVHPARPPAPTHHLGPHASSGGDLLNGRDLARIQPPPPPVEGAVRVAAYGQPLSRSSLRPSYESDAQGSLVSGRGSLLSIRNSAMRRTGSLKSEGRVSSTLHLSPLPASPDPPKPRGISFEPPKPRGISFERASIDLEDGAPREPNNAALAQETATVTPSALPTAPRWWQRLVMRSRE